MRKLVLLSLLMVVGCGKARPTVEPHRPKGGPDLTGVLRVSSRFGFGHSCPVAPDKSYTSGHVVDPMPFDVSAPLLPVKWSVGDQEGTGVSVRSQWHRDLAEIRVSEGESFPVVFPLAKRRPLPGDRVHVLGYDRRTQANVFADRPFRPKLLRIVAGVLFIDQNSGPGSSGSCVLNDNGEVVGILEGWVETEDGKHTGIAVALWAGIEDERPKPRPVPPVVTVVE